MKNRNRFMKYKMAVLYFELKPEYFYDNRNKIKKLNLSTRKDKLEIHNFINNFIYSMDGIIDREE